MLVMNIAFIMPIHGALKQPDIFGIIVVSVQMEVLVGLIDEGKHDKMIMPDKFCVDMFKNCDENV
jgi:hypothetical protein